MTKPIYTLSVETDMKTKKVRSITVCEHASGKTEVVLDLQTPDALIDFREWYEHPASTFDRFGMIICNDTAWTFNTLRGHFANMEWHGRIVDLQAIATLCNAALETSDYGIPFFENHIYEKATTAWKEVASYFGFDTKVEGVAKNELWFKIWEKQVNGHADLYSRIKAHDQEDG